MKWLVLALTLLFAITPAAAWNKHGYGTPSAPTLPLIGNLVVRLSASDITGLSNGASVASWTAAVGGQVFTDTTSDPPVYATNRINGLPSVAIHNDPAIGCESPSSTAACNGLSASSYETNCSPTLSATCSTTPYYWAGDGLHLKGQSGASCGYCILSTSPPSGIAGDFLAAIEAVP